VSFLQQPAAAAYAMSVQLNGANEILPKRGHLMNAYTHFTDATACCAFCVKPLPIVNGELQPWRAPSGQFFCNEFCADDAEEACFQSHRGADRRANDLIARTSV
jgi:hypothetical protein